MKKQIVLLAIFICLVYSQAANYKKVIVDDKDALCLDGSPGAYYISEGTATNKFLIYFEGGGWCGDKDAQTTAQNCYQRSQTDLGSSKKYPDTLSVGDGLLSNSNLNSFRTFTKVYFKYCDGSGHQGTRSQPFQFKDSKLYFRGSNLTISKLNHL
jgi:hypothetical protein